MAELSQVSYAALEAEDIWLLQEGHCLRDQVLDVCALSGNNDFNRRFTFESGSLETLKSLVSSYSGYTLLPYLACDGIGPKTMLIPFEPPIPAREIGMVYIREHYKSELLSALENAIIAAVPLECSKIRGHDIRVLPVVT